MDSKEKRFQENIKKWELICPFAARQLAQYQPSRLSLVHSENGELNLKSDQGFYHSFENPSEDTKNWFSLLDLEHKETLIIFGIGLGYAFDAALEWLHQKKEHVLVFLEDDLEVLRRLFETDKAGLILEHPQVSIYFLGLSPKQYELIQGLNFAYLLHEIHFAALPFYYKIKHELNDLLFEYLYLLKFTKVGFLSESFNNYKSIYLNLINNFLSLSNALDGEKLYKRFQGIPAIICGAGPSISRNVAVLKDLKDRALIFAGGTAMNVLNAYGVNPHFGAGLDPNWTQVTRIIMNDAFEIPLFFALRMNYIGLREVHADRVFVSLSPEYNFANTFLEKFVSGYKTIPCGQNVVNMCLSIAHAMGCDPIICVGVDLAYTENRGYGARIPHHPLHDRRETIRTKAASAEQIAAVDIYGNPIQTLSQWIGESMWYSRFAKENKDVTMLNATEGGLGFEGVENIDLRSAADQYLQNRFDLDTLIQGELSLAEFSEPINQNEVKKWISSYQEEFEMCFPLILKTIQLYQKMEKEGASEERIDQLREMKGELERTKTYKDILQAADEAFVLFCGEEVSELELDGPVLSEVRTERKIKFGQQRYLLLNDIIQSFFSLFGTIEEIQYSDKTETSLNIEWEGIYRFEDQVLFIRDEECELEIEEKFVPEKRTLYHPSGKVKMEECLLDGKLHGPSTYYNEQGEVFAQGWYLNGEKIGKAWGNYPSGRLKSLSRFRSGVQHGLHETFYENGTPKSRIPYVDGLLDGTVRLYYPNGQLKLEIEYAHGKRNGVEHYYNDQGTLLSEVFFRENRPCGETKEWSEKGDVIREIVFDEEGHPKNMRMVGRDGKLHEVPIQETRDDFDLVSLQAKILTDSISGIFNSAKQLLSAVESEELRKDLSQLKSLEEQLKKEMELEKVSPEDVFWKTPLAEKMMKKGLDEEVGKMQDSIEQIRKELKKMKERHQKDQADE